MKLDPSDPTITQDSTPDPVIPTTISINGVDYDPNEVQSFIDKGKQTIDLEKQWDTSVDKVWPEYGKTRESLKTIEAERDAARKELDEFRAKQAAGTDTKTDLADAKAAARELGLTLNEDLEKSGYIKKEDLPKYLQEFNQEQEAVKKVLNRADELEKEIDGKDGRPAFNKKVVLAYANAYGKGDLMEAYEDMHKPQLDAWKTAQVEAKKTQGLKTLSQGGSKEPRSVRVTDDNAKDLLRESLYGTKE